MHLSLLQRLVLTGLCFFIVSGVAGQPYYNQTSRFLKANSVWAFGNQSGLNFNSGGPVPIQTAMPAIMEGCASAASPLTGQLLFYSDGDNCWNAGNLLMPNGTSLMGMYSTLGTTTQGICIVPMIDSPGKYFLFSLSYQGTPPSLFYSVLDMSLDGGLGDIVPGQKGIQLGTDTLSESMIAVPGDNCDVWLVVHAFAKAQFLAYHITRDGLNTTPVISNTGQSIQEATAYMIGAAAVSPDRHMIAIASMDWNCLSLPPPGTWGTILARFDPGTGIVSDGMKVIGDTVACYGVCFSPDNSKLYTGTWNLSNIGSIYQFNVSVFDSATITASATNVHSASQQWPAYLKLYNDTIYIPDYTTFDPLGNPIMPAYLDRINKPNLSGTACNYQQNAITLLPNTYSQLGLPNAVVYPLPPDTSSLVALDTTICTTHQAQVNVTLTASPGYYGYQWDDNTTADTRTINIPGTYWVLCKDSCHSQVDTFIVRYADITFSLGNDTLLCDSTLSLKLSADVPGATYLWQDGSNGSTCNTKGSGDYWVMVSKDGCKASDTVHVEAKSFRQYLGPDTVLCKESPIHIVLKANMPEGSMTTWNTGDHTPSVTVTDTGYYWVSVTEAPCKGSDTIHITNEICECIFIVPTAFTPNGDGLNDMLQARIVPGCKVSRFMLSVYNRYGERVYSGTESDAGWDGLYKGAPADVGTYFFELHFTGGRDEKKYYQKGDVTLIR